VDSLSRQKWYTSRRINLHQRLAGSSKHLKGTASCQRSQRPRCDSEKNLSLDQWADFFLENHSKPPVRAEKTHQVNLRVVKHLKKAFAARKLVDITADDIELYLRDRLRKTVRIKTALGYRDKGALKPTTVHQELRVFWRMLNVAVRKKLLQANPCWGVEFPVTVRGLFSPSLCHVVGTTTHRIPRPTASSECHSDHHGDGPSGLQGTDSHEEGPSRPR
jgi:hypothetical protein